MPLSQLKPKMSGIIETIDQKHPLRRRLLELGFIPGARVHIVRQAPLGDPVQITIGGSDLALCKKDLEGIWVEA